MRCPFCSVDNDRVVDSRVIGEGSEIRRRRKCLKCNRRFTTYERILAAPHIVVKKDGRREFFDRQKILSGMITACHKRKISHEQLESIGSRIEAQIFEEYESEVSSQVIGEKVSNALKELDDVAYVRFASVYREFKDVHHFLAELTPLLQGAAVERSLKSPAPGHPAVRPAAVNRAEARLAGVHGR